MSERKFDLGMIGLGVMGRNLALNMADHGFSVVGYDLDADEVKTLEKAAGHRPVRGVNNLEELAALLKEPRAVMLLVPAGAPVDAVIRSLLPYLKPGDLIIDGGNSHFKDTNLRAQSLSQKGIKYLGVGISGGESGARYGPSIMPGGPRQAYERVKSIFEAVAAKADGEPCVAYLGPGSAGHYVKMVHNGIEYGMMQLIAETYDLMKRGIDLSDEEIHKVYESWNQSELNSFLIEISANVMATADKETGKRLIDVILDEAKQKGTGRWASQDAMDLLVPVPTFDVAVAMRNLSAYKDERQAASRLYKSKGVELEGDPLSFLDQLRNALYAALIITFAQGMAQLRAASQHYGYDLGLEAVARIWHNGCIIRAALLEKVRAAFQENPALPNLLLDSSLSKEVMLRRIDLCSVVQSAAQMAIPSPGLAVSLAYFDAYRSAWLPANLIQAQRDYFGAHTYERIDEKGVFHTEWREKEA